MNERDAIEQRILTKLARSDELDDTVTKMHAENARLTVRVAELKKIVAELEEQIEVARGAAEYATQKYNDLLDGKVVVRCAYCGEAYPWTTTGTLPRAETEK